MEESISLISVSYPRHTPIQGLENFGKNSKLKVTLTPDNLFNQKICVVDLFLADRRVQYDLHKIKEPKKNALAINAYQELKEIQPYTDKQDGLLQLILSSQISIQVKKRYFYQLPLERQKQIAILLNELGQLDKIQSFASKLSWHIQYQFSLPGGLSWCAKKNKRLPSVEKYWNKLGSIRGNFFVFGDKPGGAEPGFLATKINNAFFNYFLSYSNEYCSEIHQQFNQDHKLKNFIKNIYALNLTDKEFLEAFSYNMTKQTKEGDIPLKVYMFKQDYEGKKKTIYEKLAGKAPSHVGASIERLKKDPFIKETLPVILHRTAAEVKKRSRAMQLPEDQNTNAIIETFVNDVLKTLGLPSQSQQIIFSSYEDGSPKILTACLWEKGAIPGDHFLKGSYNPSYEGYYVRNSKKKGLAPYESIPLKNSAHCLIAALATGNRDEIGRDGDNKMLLNLDDLSPSLFCIDPGLALREESSILDTLGTDFSFLQPWLIPYKYKNLTALTDNPITEKMMAMFILYRAIPQEWRESCFKHSNETLRVEAAIRQYEEIYPEFAAQMQQIEEGGIGRLFETYREYLAIQLDDSTHSPEWRIQFGHFLNQLDSAYGRLARNIRKLMHTFAQRMTLSPQELELLDQLEKKFSDRVSHYSSCGKIKLNYPRIVSGRAIFEMKKYKNPDGSTKSITLDAPLHKKSLLTEYLKTIPGLMFEDRTNPWSSSAKICFSNKHFQNFLDYNSILEEEKESFTEQMSKNPYIKSVGETFLANLALSFQEALLKISHQLTTDQRANLEKEITSLLEKLGTANQFIDSNSLREEMLIKHQAIKALKSFYQTFDQNYSKGIFGFFSGQTFMRRDFFNIVCFAFKEEIPDIDSTEEPHVVKTLMKTIEEKIIQNSVLETSDDEVFEKSSRYSDSLEYSNDENSLSI